MRPFRFMHAADLHLDSPFRGLANLPEAIRRRIVDSPYEALQQLVAVGLREQVDAVLLSGDIYDDAHRSLRAQLALQAAMEQFAEQQIQVFIVHGNHDPMTRHETGLTLPANVHVFGSEQVTSEPLYDRMGLVVAHVHGISYPKAAVTNNLAADYHAVDRSVYNVAMLHCNVDGDQQHEPYAPCTSQQLIHSGMDYWALGHVHTRRVLHSDPYIVYPGNTQGRHVRESGAKGCYVVDVTAQKTAMLTFHRTDAIVWQQVAVPIDAMHSEQDLITSLDELAERLRKEGGGRPTVLRIILEGDGPLHERLQQPAWQEELSDWLRQREASRVQDDHRAPFVWLESMQVNTGHVLPWDKLLQEDSFLGDVLRQSQHLMQSDEWRAYVKNILQPLYEHRIAGRYIDDLLDEQIEQWWQAAREEAARLLRTEGK